MITGVSTVVPIHYTVVVLRNVQTPTSPIDQSRHSSSVSVIVFVAEPCFFMALVKLGKRPILPAGQTQLGGKSILQIQLLRLASLLHKLSHWNILELRFHATYGHDSSIYHWPQHCYWMLDAVPPSLRVSHLPARLLVVHSPWERRLLERIDLRFAAKSRNHLS